MICFSFLALKESFGCAECYTKLLPENVWLGESEHVHSWAVEASADTEVVVDTANVSGGHTLPVALKTVPKSLPTEDFEGDRQADGLRNSRW